MRNWAITTAARQFALCYTNKKPQRKIMRKKITKKEDSGEEWAARKAKSKKTMSVTRPSLMDQFRPDERRYTQKRGDQLNRLVEAGFAYLFKRGYCYCRFCRAGRRRTVGNKGRSGNHR